MENKWDVWAFVAGEGNRVESFAACDPGCRVLEASWDGGISAQMLTAQEMEILSVGSYLKQWKAKLPPCEKNAFAMIYSVQCFHWMKKEELRQCLARFFQALRPEGKLVCEFGAVGNALRLRDCFSTKLKELGKAYVCPYYFPSPEEFRALLEEAGFSVGHTASYGCAEALPGREAGLERWCRHFFAESLEQCKEAEKKELLFQMEQCLRGELWQNKAGLWLADFRRLQAVAFRQG